MAEYYIHRAGRQELGSITIENPKPRRGRYFLISKRCLDFFPHISSIVLNDKIILSIIPMFPNQEQCLVYSTMDYHNQKFADITYEGKNPRNEVRLYLNSDIDPDLYFVAGDIVVFEKIRNNDELVYSLTKVSKTDNGYAELNSLLLNDKRFESNYIYEGELDFIKKPDFDNITDVVVTKEAEDVIKNESEAFINTGGEADPFEDEMGSELFTEKLFRDFVMKAYNYRCAVTGKVIKYKDLYNLEAAHIKAQAHHGTFLPCNGIALSRDLHFAFDKGFFTISDDYKIIVSEKLNGDWFYEEFNNKEIFVPSEPFFRPRKSYLEHHRIYVFNTFSQIRKLPK